MVTETIETPCDVLSIAISRDQKLMASAHSDMAARVSMKVEKQ